MKMAKASERDIDAAGNAMSVLQTISSGYFPTREGEEDAPTFLDPNDRDHLRRFYDMMNETLDASPGWPGRVIGGMCYVIMYDKNRIVDPDADVIELHPRFAEMEKQRDELLTAIDQFMDPEGNPPENTGEWREVLRVIASVKGSCVQDSAKSETQADLSLTEEAQTAIPAIVFYPAGSLGEEVHS